MGRQGLPRPSLPSLSAASASLIAREQCNPPCLPISSRREQNHVFYLPLLTASEATLSTKTTLSNICSFNIL